MEQFEEGYALLIGTGSDEKIKTATVNDATELGNILKTSALFPQDHVAVLTETEATKERIINGLKWLVGESDMTKTVIIYYAGHGEVPENTVNEDYYFVPYGFDKKKLTPRITRSEFTDLVNKIKAKKLIVFLSCCHASGLAVGLSLEESDFLSENQKLVDALYGGTGRAVIASCHATEKSWFKKGDRFTFFGKHLIEALKGKAATPRDKYVNLLQVMIYLFNHVPDSANEIFKEQRPVLNLSHVSDSLVLSKNEYYSEDEHQRYIKGLNQNYEPQALGNKLEVFEREGEKVSSQIESLENNVQKDDLWRAKYIALLEEKANIEAKKEYLENKRMDDLIITIQNGTEEYILLLIRKYYFYTKRLSINPDNFGLNQELRETETNLKEIGIEPKLLIGKYAQKIKEALGL